MDIKDQSTDGSMYPICALGAKGQGRTPAAGQATYDIPYFTRPKPRPRKSLLHRLLDLLGRLVQ